ncbi:MAG: hypothetical protein AAF757_09410 [Cyanobacteria bacterium P01_D01_bin.116]
MSQKPDITFVCCIESGSLELQTIRMIESLRRWGGKFANVPVYAVSPRFSPPIAKSTRLALKKFQVEHLSFQTKNKYSWYKFLNKPLSLAAVEKIANTELIGWLDSDLIVVDEPCELDLSESESVTACASDKNVGTSGLGDPNEPYWKEVCQHIGLEIEDLPWTQTELEKERIRLYWNSGIFSYRRSTNLGQEYLNTVIQLLDASIASHKTKIYFHEQMSIGLAATKNKIPWSPLSRSHNFSVNTNRPKEYYNLQEMKTAKIIHYHGAMTEESYWDTFIELLNNTHPTVADWLIPLGSIQKNQTKYTSRLLRKLIDYNRLRKQKAYSETLKVI